MVHYSLVDEGLAPFLAKYQDTWSKRSIPKGNKVSAYIQEVRQLKMERYENERRRKATCVRLITKRVRLSIPTPCHPVKLVPCTRDCKDKNGNGENHDRYQQNGNKASSESGIFSNSVGSSLPPKIQLEDSDSLETPSSDNERVDNQGKADEEWKVQAVESQQMYYECFKDREFDEIQSHQGRMLTLKVGYALYGMPTEDDEQQPYSKSIMRDIKKVTDVFYKISETQRVIMGVIFAVGKVRSSIISIPVFKILKCSLSTNSTTVFLDGQCRQYSSWEQFLKKNHLPKGFYAYPKDGIYQGDDNGRVLLTFLPSPSNSLSSKLLFAADIATTTTNVAAMAVALSLPPAAPIALAVGAACNVYYVVKESIAIHDRRIHKQSISFGDKDARRLWFCTIGSSIGVLSGFASAGVVNLAAKGRNIGLAVRIPVNVVNCSFLAVKGVGVMDNFVSLIMKARYKELNKQDLLNFTMSLLFFTNLVVSMKTAEDLIAQVQREIGLAESEEGFFRSLATWIQRKLVDKSYVQSDISIKVSNQIVKQITELNLLEIQGCLVKQVIKSSNGYCFEMSDDLKAKIEKLIVRYLGPKKKDFSSRLIRQSEKLTKDEVCSTEDGFINIFRFLLIYKGMRLKEMEKEYERKRRIKKELLGDNFDEALFDKENGIQYPENKSKWFEDAVDKEIEESNDKLKEEYENSIKEITAINEDGSMRFFSSLTALNEYFHSFVIDGQELCPIEFFRIIRELVDNYGEIMVWENGKIYSDPSVPVYVNVVKNEEGSFFESVSFVSVNDILLRES